ncbi:hypothetical protein [Streptomyces sp. GC420]|uniref:hypothetical protein n=1 Tax=Streptomyces sp. GC420 TaxID=2697568 RepID=UPI0028BF1366|nr:hypothetical protein [Streptomyces sp. GC420]
MTAPLTPHNRPAHGDSAMGVPPPEAGGGPAYDPWRTPQAKETPRPPHAPHAPHAPYYAHGEERAPLGPEIGVAAAAAAVVAATGVVLGLLWLWLAPRVPLVSDGSAVLFKDSEGEQAVGADGTFMLLALGMGALTALGVFLFRRSGGVPLVVGLAVGGLLGSLLAWRLGVWLGPSDDVVARAREAGKGVVFDAPLELHAAGGAMLAWPIASMLVFLGLTALFAPRDPDPYDQQKP